MQKLEKYNLLKVDDNILSSNLKIRNEFKKSRYNLFKRNKLLTLILICIIFIIIFVIVFKRNNNNLDYNNTNIYYQNINKYYKKEDIIDSNNYIPLEKMKFKYKNDSFFNNYTREISIYSHLYHKNISQFKKNKNNINLCMSLNNRFVYPTLVAIESALINCNKTKTFITYHALCAPNVKNEALSIIKSLINKYYLNLEIILYNMGNIFINNNEGRFSQAAYYRLLSPIIFDLERILYLDGDTITFKDLSEMYQIEFDDNYILGFLDIMSNGVDHLGIKSERYINSGVVLLNLEKIRKDNKTFELIKALLDDIPRPSVDQTIINYVLYPKIGILPSKYTTWNFEHRLDIEKYLDRLRLKQDFNELLNSIDDTCVMHICLCGPKAWLPDTKYNIFSACKQWGDCSCKKYQDLWYFYAKKTQYYYEILNYYNYTNYTAKFDEKIFMKNQLIK